MKKLLTILLMAFMAIPMVAQEVGLQLYSLRNQFKEDVTKTLDIVQSWGITKLEGGETYGMALEDFQKELASRNLSVVSVGASYEDLEKNPQKVIDNAKAFGATYVMCAWIDHKGDNFDINNAKKAVEIFNVAGKQLSEAGLKLVYHMHGYEFRPYKDGTLFDYMAKHAEYFAFEMDVYWVKHGGADPMTLLNKYPDLFYLMHLKDMEKGVVGDNTGHSDVETNVVLGTGQIEMASLVMRAKTLGIEYLFIEDESSSVVEQVPQSLAFLKHLDE